MLRMTNVPGIGLLVAGLTIAAAGGGPARADDAAGVTRLDDAPVRRGLALHLVPGEGPQRDAPRRSLRELGAAIGEPLIAADDVRGWDPETGTLFLTADGAAALAKLRDAGPTSLARAFVLVADGEPLLVGLFFSNIMSSTCDDPVIILDDVGERTVVQRSYHGRTTGPDPRRDPRLRAAAVGAMAAAELRGELTGIVAGYGKGDGVDWRAMNAETLIARLAGEKIPSRRMAIVATLGLDHAGRADAVDALRALAADGKANPSDRVLAGAGLALRGAPADARPARPVLRQVLADRSFASTASGKELGWAALGLALIADLESRDAVQKHVQCRMPFSEGTRIGALLLDAHAEVAAARAKATPTPKKIRSDW